MHQDKLYSQQIFTVEHVIEAVEKGSFFGFIKAKDNSVLWLYEYEKKLYGKLEGPLTDDLEKLLDYLCETSFLDAVIATERPKEYFEANELVQRSRHLRKDLDD